MGKYKKQIKWIKSRKQYASCPENMHYSRFLEHDYILNTSYILMEVSYDHNISGYVAKVIDSNIVALINKQIRVSKISIHQYSQLFALLHAIALNFGINLKPFMSEIDFGNFDIFFVKKNFTGLYQLELNSDKIFGMDCWVARERDIEEKCDENIKTSQVDVKVGGQLGKVI